MTSERLEIDLVFLVFFCIKYVLIWSSFCVQGWTLLEILRYAPQHNWTAYEEALKSNPVLAKMVISGVVYSVGDWIAQVLNMSQVESSYLCFSKFLAK